MRTALLIWSLPASMFGHNSSVGIWISSSASSTSRICAAPVFRRCRMENHELEWALRIDVRAAAGGIHGAGAKDRLELARDIA